MPVRRSFKFLTGQFYTMNSTDLITLVIHTPERADKLKGVLEAHNIYTSLEPVKDVADQFTRSPVKVRIKISDLRQSLKILESADFVSSPLALAKMGDRSHTLLIPVDFSPSSILAVKVGFYLAQKFEVEPVILHSYIAPQIIQTDFYDNQVDPIEMPDFADVEEEIDLRNAASRQLSKFKKSIEKSQTEGEIAAIKFSTSLLEGIPEQVIHEYCRQNKPMMVVMATRGIDKKETDLIGSVTAEVIDSCRVPVLTVPDNYKPVGVEGVKNIAMFCNFTAFDAITLRGLMRTFSFPSCDIWLLPASESSLSSGIDAKLEHLQKYFTELYPTATFHTSRLGKGKFDDNMRRIIDQNDIRLIIVPNKKSNAINRFFHPTLAHRILFERDIPLLVLPV